MQGHVSPGCCQTCSRGYFALKLQAGDECRTSPNTVWLALKQDWPTNTQTELVWLSPLFLDISWQRRLDGRKRRGKITKIFTSGSRYPAEEECLDTVAIFNQRLQGSGSEGVLGYCGDQDLFGTSNIWGNGRGPKYVRKIVRRSVLSPLSSLLKENGSGWKIS